MKNLLHHILSGKEFAISSGKLYTFWYASVCIFMHYIVNLEALSCFSGSNIGQQDNRELTFVLCQIWKIIVHLFLYK
jgi:hypothetical protein